MEIETMLRDLKISYYTFNKERGSIKTSTNSYHQLKELIEIISLLDSNKINYNTDEKCNIILS